MVSILVMNREKMPVLIIKLSRAFCANEPVNVQGPFSVIVFWYCTFFQFSYNLINVLTTIFFSGHLLFFTENDFRLMYTPQ